MRQTSDHQGARRTLAAAVVVLLTALAAMVSLPPASAEDAPTPAMGLTWKMSNQAFTGSSLSPAHATTAPATKTADGFSFPETSSVLYNPATGAASVSFPGSYDLGNTAQGNYRIRIGTPTVNLEGDGTGTLSALVSYALDPGVGQPHVFSTPVRATVATFTLPEGALVDTGTHVSFTVTPDFILRTDLNPNPNTFHQFPQPLLDALSPQLISHFRETAAGTYDTKAPAPLTVSFAYGAKPVGLTWKMSNQAFTGSSLSPAHATTAPATKTADGFSFPQASSVVYDAETGAAQISYPGSYDLGNTVQGNYRIRVADPVVIVDADGVGRLDASVSYALDPGVGQPHVFSTPVVATVATFTVTDDQLVTIDGNVHFIVTPDFILRTDLNPNPNTFHQFPQPLLDALSPQLISHFRETAAGTYDTKAPAPLTVSFDFAKANQAIDFAALPDRFVDDGPFTVAATASSGLPVTFSTEGACSIDGAEITVEEVGTCTVTADQAGNANWRAAPSATQAFAVFGDDEAFVRRAYQVVLDRPADTDGLAYWLARLEGGASRDVLANALATTGEARARVVDLAFQTVLQRPADAAGRTYWANRLGRDLTAEKLIVALLLSNETVSTRAHNDPGAWTEILFQTHLGRASDSDGHDYWTERAAAVQTLGQLHALALGFGRTGEATAYGVDTAVTRACGAATPTTDQRTAVTDRWTNSDHHPLRTTGTALAALCPTATTPA